MDRLKLDKSRNFFNFLLENEQRDIPIELKILYFPELLNDDDLIIDKDIEFHYKTIDNFPENLKVRRKVTFLHCIFNIKIPNIECNNLYVYTLNPKNLPDNINYLYLGYSKILPDNLHINKLDICSCDIDEIPSGLICNTIIINGDLYEKYGYDYFYNRFKELIIYYDRDEYISHFGEPITLPGKYIRLFSKC